MTWLTALGSFAGSSGGQTILGGLSGLFGGRSERREKERATKESFQQDQYFDNLKRQRDLEDRRYKEEAIGSYRQFSPAHLRGNSPAYTDPSSVNVVDPYNPQTKPKPKSERKMLGGSI